MRDVLRLLRVCNMPAHILNLSEEYTVFSYYIYLAGHGLENAAKPWMDLW